MTIRGILDKNFDDIIPRTPKGYNKKFIENVIKSFEDSFIHNFPSNVSPVKKITKWVISDRRFPLLGNLLQRAIENEIEKEDLKILNKETEEKIAELKEMMATYKQDLDYIREAAKVKADEELKYG